MAYRMTEISDRVRVGRRGDGSLDIEVWSTPRGWCPAVERAEDAPENIFVPADALDGLFEYLR